MIDLHCHILPGVDDGSEGWEETLKMAKIAHQDGITHIFATPHANPNLYFVPARRVIALVKELHTLLQKEAIPIEVLPGHDAHMVPELLDNLKKGEVLTLANSRYFLLEPLEFVERKELQNFIFKAQMEGYIPIITHPERIGYFHRHPEVIRECCQQGALIQFTASSITGYFGEDIRKWTLNAIKEGYGHILATDAHSSGHRKPILSEAVEELKLHGMDATPWVMDYPTLILRNEPPESLKASTIIDLFSS